MKVSLKNIIVPSIPLAVLLVFSFIVLWFSSYFVARFGIQPSQNKITTDNLAFFIDPSSLLSNIISLVFTLLNAFLLDQINNRFTIIRTRTFLPVFTFLLLMSCWSETHITNSAHIVLTLSILAIYYFFSMSRDRNASEQAFMGSTLISVSSLFINSYILIIPVCWIGFIIFQSFSLRTFLASLFGTVAPWVMYVAANYLLQLKIDFSQILEIHPVFQLLPSHLSLPITIYAATFCTILVISIIEMFSLSNGDAIHTRNKLNFLVLLFIALSALALLYIDQFGLYLPLLAMVFSLIFSHPFTLRQNNFHGIIFSIFCVINFAYLISKYFQL